MDINALFTLIGHLKSQASELDLRRGEQTAFLFDDSLFHCKSHLLQPCVDELEQTLLELKKYQSNPKSYTEHVEYLCERLVNQLSAIQRELATQKLRATETHHKTKKIPSVSELYQDLAQHQDWERRLQDMLTDKLSQLDNTALYQRPEMQKGILALEQRLARCLHAKQKIEKNIARLERKNY